MGVRYSLNFGRFPPGSHLALDFCLLKDFDCSFDFGVYEWSDHFYCFLVQHYEIVLRTYPRFLIAALILVFMNGLITSVPS